MAYFKGKLKSKGDKHLVSSHFEQERYHRNVCLYTSGLTIGLI
jgi:hypothetical protein